MVELKSIGSAKWQIDKSGEMHVPVVIYGTKGIADMMKGGRTFGQAMNVAKLPGIVRGSFVMPDGHEGYGFPIGGVAAFDPDDGGVVSPGGVGYDINCTEGETNVMLKHGAYLKIKEIEDALGEHNVRFANLHNFSTRSSNILYFIKKPEKSTIYEITTKTEKHLRVTGDHPVYTKTGMRKACELNTEDCLAICSFGGIHYEKPSDEAILEEKTVAGVMAIEKESLGGNAVTQAINFLKKQNILPLKQSSPQLPYLAKILGFVLGDGSISFIKKRKGVVWFYGDETDLESIRDDIKKIGFTPSRVYKRLRKHEISTHYKKYSFVHCEYSFKVSSTAFASLLVALGAPSGLKTAKSYLIPSWLFRAPLWIKRLFIAAFFGAEMSAPTTLNKYNFYAPTLGMNKLESLEFNTVEFLTQIKELLNEFEIETSPVMKVEGYELGGKKGVTCGYRVQVLSNPENLLKFFENVSFEYCAKRFKDACLAANYVRLKERVKEQRKIARKTAISLYAGGKTVAEICDTLVDEHIAPQFIRHSLWTDHKDDPRVAFDFMSFSEYREKYALGKDGLAWDEIEEIKTVPFDDFVYDIMVNDENHNFFANGIVVSNCGVRLILTNLKASEVKPRVGKLMTSLFTNVPSGVGSKSKLRLDRKELATAVEMGAQYVIDKGYGWPEDARHIEENGRMPGADATKVSDMAMKRGMPQFGTLGAGNHFLEVQDVGTILDEKVAKAYGLERGNAVIMLHCGSRGFGHQVCDDYIRVMLNASKKYGINLPDRELCCAPLGSQEAEDYIGAMSCAVNYAFCNRQVMTHWIRETFAQEFGKKADELGMKVVYDVCHNIAKWEKHEVDGKMKKLCVHRKGATRAMGPGREEVPVDYRTVGQPVLIPGSMGTASYVLAGIESASECFFSTCHGSGRVMSRSEAIRTYKGENIKNELEGRGIAVRATDYEVISEEAPGAYKDVDEVVRSVAEAGISKIVARLVPMGVAKG